jgi:hypothetical protein
MDFIPFSENEEQRIKRFFGYDPATDQMEIVTQQDVSGLIERNKKLYNDNDRHVRGDMEHVGDIPLSLYFSLVNRNLIDSATGEAIDHDEVMKEITKFLNDSDNRHFRVKPGTF